jgi:EAL domain-containing protein (putative c-di-GMP-specific phosphodiesterase class I)
MASEKDFAELEVTDRAVELTFLPTGGRLSFARFGTLLSPGRPIGPTDFASHPVWEVEWLARKIAQEALLHLVGAASGAPSGIVSTASIDLPYLILRRDLSLAVRRNELTLHYQPLVDATTQAVVAQEALLRWLHPTRGLVMPNDFIAISEDSGAILEIGQWVLDHAIAEAATWTKPWRVSVNLSPAQFRQADPVDTVQRALARHGLPGTRLELEITEGVLIDDTSRALAVLRALKQLGCCLALDDFGTGYSNLTYLRLLPLDRIKIDKSFVHDLGTSPQVDAIVRTIISMGHALGLSVTAEGVETAAQFEFLRTHGCSEVQGYLLGKPRPAPLRRHARAPLREVTADEGRVRAIAGV